MPVEEFVARNDFANPEPNEIIAGDTLTWSRGFADYPASAGWVLTYVLNSPTVRKVVSSADVTQDGDAFAIAIPSTETATWAAGSYQWLAVVQLAGERRTVALGRLSVNIDILDATTPQDTRSQNEISLDNVNAMLSGRGGDGVQEYTINGRMLRRYTIPELLHLRGLYVSLVRQERADRGERLPSRTVAVHFG